MESFPQQLLLLRIRLLLELLADSGDIVQAVRRGGLGAGRQIPDLGDKAHQIVSIPIPRALQIIAVHITVVHAVAAAEAELSGVVVIVRIRFQNEELVGPRVKASVGRVQGRHVLAIGPPEVAAVVRVLVLDAAGAVAVAQEGARADGRKFQIEGVHALSPAGFRHAAGTFIPSSTALALWHHCKMG